MRELSGKTAFITGGDSGIGLGTAEVFCEAGLKVIICGLTDESVSAASERLSAHGEAHGVVLDVRDREAYAQVADWIGREHGGVDVLFNNAGVGFLGSALAATFEQWDWVMDINLTGVYNGIRTFVPRMIASGRPGHVIATASIAGLVGAPATVYAAAKFGVVGLMESLALELRDTPIGVSVLTPGLVSTNIAHGPPPPGGVLAAGPAGPPAEHGSVAKMEPRQVGECVLNAIQDDQLYIITHAEHHDLLAQRHEAIMRSVPDEDVDPRRAERELTMLANPVYAAQRQPRPGPRRETWPEQLPTLGGLRMQHIRMPGDDEIPDEAREFLEAEGRRRGAPVSAAIRTLAWRPDIMQAVATLQRVVMTAGSVDVELKALVAQAVSEAAGCRHCQAHAAFMASRVGKRSDRVKALWEFETSDLFTAAERAALRLAVAAGGVPNCASEEHFVELRRYFDEGQIVEIVATMALFGWNNRWNDTVATVTEDGPALFALDALGDQGFELGRHRPDL